MLSTRVRVEFYVEQLSVKLIWNGSCLYVKGGSCGLIGSTHEICLEELKKTN
jgi:hypothetical protein